MSSVPYLVSTSDLAPGQNSLSRLPQPTTALDRQVILRQLSLVCTSVQMLAETLTTAYVSAVEPSASPGIAQRLDATRVANQLDYLTITLKTLAESLLAANEIVEEPPRTVDEDEEGRAARDTGRVTAESGTFTPLSISTENVTLELRECCVCINKKPVQEFLKAMLIHTGTTISSRNTLLMKVQTSDTVLTPSATLAMNMFLVQSLH
ncbi:hypothetical protein L207DRAFT_576003 [Hyaloscypha variabilis F]|uniref:Uncharacterized protein n=1 Tax=Hyaloscypha variabilis (strain UAMH 11265 / GT02V1 / F) TaxID=1149755 RepID=A0A2J6S8Y5_HYAVF|nr:hypothetical protein L207DRAFT_576003 [Hyaloscypha variabilis F]